MWRRAGEGLRHRLQGTQDGIRAAQFPESFERRGIGEELLTGILREARDRGLIASIHVERQNPALKLYQRLRFQIAGEPGPVYLRMEFQAPEL